MKDRLAYAACAFAAIGGSIILSACGGGGSSFSSTGGSSGGSTGGFGGFDVNTFNVQVTLPSGGAAAPTRSVDQLSVWNSLTAKSPGADGRVAIDIFDEGPQYTEARDDQGRLVVAGFLGEGRTVMDAETTAEMLAFFALGGGVQRDGGAMAVLEGIRNLSGFDAVAAEVADQLTANGYVEEGEGPLSAALAGFVQSHKGMTPNGTIVDPTYASGIVMDTSVTDQLKVVNTYLRRGAAWLTRTGYKVGDSITEENELIQKFDLAVPSRYSGWSGAVADIILGNNLWIPREMGPFPIPRTPEAAEETYYELVVVGPGGAVDPSVWNQLTPEQQQVQGEKAMEAIYLDFVMPLVANIVLPLTAGHIEDLLGYAGGDAALADIIKNSLTTYPQAAEALRDGRFNEALNIVWTGAFTSSTTFNVLLEIMDAWMASMGNSFGGVDPSGRAARIQSAMRMLTVVDLVFSTFDLGILLHDINASNAVDIFEIKSSGGKVVLEAQKLHLDIYEITSVTAVIHGSDPDSAYKYEWQVTEGFKLTDANGKTTDDEPSGILTTSLDVVALESKDREAGVAKVTCKVTRLTTPEDRPEGSDEINITFTDGQPLLAPHIASVYPNSTKSFRAQLNNSTHDGPVEWEFSVIEGGGTINTTGRSTNPFVVYTAGPDEGTATLQAEGFIRAEGETRSIGKTTSEIRIERTPTIIEGTAKIVWAPQADNPNRHTTTMVVEVPLIEDAIGYQLDAKGGFDPDYWGYNVKAAWGPNSVPIGCYFSLSHLKSDEVAWICLSGTSGPMSGQFAAQAWLESRFNYGWVWTVKVNYGSANVPRQFQTENLYAQTAGASPQDNCCSLPTLLANQARR